MPVFAYKVSGADASRKSGTIVADTPRTARDTLRARGWSVQHLVEQSAAAKTPLLGRSRRKRLGKHTVGFVRELATLLGVGVPLLEAIDTIALQYKGEFHGALLELRDRIASGTSLAEAMRQQPDVFDEFCVSLTEVGESAGNLDTVLERLADFKERSAALKDRVLTAVLYPMIVLVMALGVSLFLMTFVVPKLLAGLLEAGQDIPLATQILKGISDFLVHRWWLLLIVLFAIISGIGAILRSPKGKLAWHRLQLKIPIAGEMIRKQSIMRAAVVISTLMRSGIVFEKAVQIARSSVGNLVIGDALQRCETAVRSGQNISEAVGRTGAFPPTVVQMFAVGQQSGRLEEMLERLATDYDRQLTTASQRLTAVLEPVLILLLVVIIGFIAFATVLPMLEAADVF